MWGAEEALTLFSRSSEAELSPRHSCLGPTATSEQPACPICWGGRGYDWGFLMQCFPNVLFPNQ